MGRRSGGVEGSVREDPPGSGSWQGRLPKRVDPYRRAIPGRYPTQTACRRALNKAIADLDAGRLAKPQGKPADTVRRLRQSVEEYIEDRRTDAMDPIAVNTVRDYTDTLKNVINHPRANLGRTPLDRVDGPALDKWLRLLHGAGVSHRRSAKGFAIVRATMGWEVRQGRIAVNVARQVRRVSTKKGRAQRQTADPVLLPSWSELAALAAAPKLREDRLLLLTIAWCGLRWAEAVSLGVTDVWPVRPRLSVRRTFIWDATVQECEQEVVKAGLAVAIPMPTPLWEALRELAESRSVDERMGGDLLFRPVRSGLRVGGLRDRDLPAVHRHDDRHMMLTPAEPEHQITGLHHRPRNVLRLVTLRVREIDQGNAGLAPGPRSQTRAVEIDRTIPLRDVATPSAHRCQCSSHRLGSQCIGGPNGESIDICAPAGDCVGRATCHCLR